MNLVRLTKVIYFRQRFTYHYSTKDTTNDQANCVFLKNNGGILKVTIFLMHMEENEEEEGEGL